MEGRFSFRAFSLDRRACNDIWCLVQSRSPFGNELMGVVFGEAFHKGESRSICLSHLPDSPLPTRNTSTPVYHTNEISKGIVHHGAARLPRYAMKSVTFTLLKTVCIYPALRFVSIRFVSLFYTECVCSQMVTANSRRKTPVRISHP